MFIDTKVLNAELVIKHLKEQGWLTRKLEAQDGEECSKDDVMFKLFYRLPVFPTTVEAIARAEKLSESEVMAWLKTGECPELPDPCFHENCFVPDLPTG